MRPATDDSPIASGSAKATKIWSRASGRHSAFDPTQRLSDTEMSTTAKSLGTPSTSRRRILFRTVASAAGTLPVATRPVANPAMVASRNSGKTLLVPGGERHDGNISAGAGHQTLRPIPAKDHNGPRPGRHHLRCTPHRVGGAILNGHVKELNLRPLVIPVRCKRTSNSLGDTTSIRNHQDASTPVTPSARDQPDNDAALLCDGEDSPLRDQAPDITARCRVGYDSNNVFAGGKNLPGPRLLAHSAPRGREYV